MNDPLTVVTPGQAVLRQAIIAEIREAASCDSDDGNECRKCTRHADAILAAVTAAESHIPLYLEETGRLRTALTRLSTVLHRGGQDAGSVRREAIGVLERAGFGYAR